MSSTRVDSDLKLILLGAEKTGKTCLFNRYIHQKLGDAEKTISAYCGFKNEICLWDTSGDPQYALFIDFYLPQATGAIICVDLTQDYAAAHVAITKYGLQIAALMQKNFSITIAATKYDLVESNPSARQLTINQLQLLAKRLADVIKVAGQKILIYEVSAKLGLGVNELFEGCIAEKKALVLAQSQAMTDLEKPKWTTQAKPLIHYANTLFGLRHHHLKRAKALHECIKICMDLNKMNLIRHLLECQKNWMGGGHEMVCEIPAEDKVLFTPVQLKYLMTPSQKNKKADFYSAVCETQENFKQR